MAELISFNGAPFIVPDVGDSNWGQNVTDLLVAIPAGCLQKIGGSFTLTADVDFGSTHGLLSKYFISKSTSPATTGVVRLADTDNIDWRNRANSADIALSKDTSDNLLWNGHIISGSGTGPVTSVTGTTNQIIASSATGAVTLSTPQDIASVSSPTFTGLVLSSASTDSTKINLVNTSSGGKNWAWVSGGSSGSNVTTGAAVLIDTTDAMNAITVTRDGGSGVAFVGINVNQPTGNLEVDGPNCFIKGVSTLGRVGQVEIALVQDEAGPRTYGGYFIMGRNGVTDSNLRWNKRVNNADATCFTIENSSGNMSIGGDIANSGFGAAVGNLTGFGSLGAESGTSTPNGIFCLQSTNNLAITSGLSTTTNIYGWIQARDTSASTYYDLVLQPSGGKVGIGTISPSTTLHVNGTTTLGGASTLGGAMNANSHKITSVTNGTSLGDALAYGQSLVQIVQATSTSTVTTTSATFVTTSFSASITPKSAINKVIVFMSATLNNATANVQAYIDLNRGATSLSGSTGFASTFSAGGQLLSPISAMFVDSPATTSSTTYTVFYKSDGTHTIGFNPSGLTASLILVEVGA